MSMETGSSRTDRGVSPVIGVILMVAITVILAAVIGTFVLDLGQQTGQVAPQASLEYSTNGDGTVSVDHQGDRLSRNNTEVVVRNESGNGETYRVSFDDGAGNWAGQDSVNVSDWEDDRIATGDRFIIEGLEQDDEYQIVVIDTETNQQISEASLVA